MGTHLKSTHRELSDEYQHCFQKYLCPCALDISNLSIGRVNAMPPPLQDRCDVSFNIKMAAQFSEVAV